MNNLLGIVDIKTETTSEDNHIGVGKIRKILKHFNIVSSLMLLLRFSNIVI